MESCCDKMTLIHPSQTTNLSLMWLDHALEQNAQTCSYMVKTSNLYKSFQNFHKVLLDRLSYLDIMKKIRYENSFFKYHHWYQATF